ncbi:AzlC family ABC transporter permease [Thermobispora bispora]|uniref:AzlC family ABC transporter permease n=1 Tax=Thermobispora bispora TaxID=2006 RepID=UPI00068114E0|nr:AzlC family ABC transporter permease [Thermobispora bispora]
MTSAPASAETERPARSRAAVVRDSLAVGITVGLSGFAFGVTSVGSGLDVAQTCALSLLVFTGASQFALVGSLGAGGGVIAAVAGALLLGVRNAFYGLRLSHLLALPRAVRPLAAQWVIDETSAVAFAQPNRRSARLGFLVTGATLFVVWNLTTFAGALGAAALGDPAAWGLDAAGPAVFLALLVAMVRGAPRASGARLRPEPLVAGLAAVLALACAPFLPPGAPVLVAVLAAPIVLALVRPRAKGGAA